MRKDVREFVRRLEAVCLAVEPTPGHYRVLRRRQAAAEGEWDAVHAAVLARHDSLAQIGDRRATRLGIDL
jgi:hypothetical protein